MHSHTFLVFSKQRWNPKFKSLSDQSQSTDKDTRINNNESHDQSPDQPCESADLSEDSGNEGRYC